MADYHAQAAKNLRLTSVAVTTDSDRKPLPLLQKEFDHMQELGNKILAARKNLNYIIVESVKKDPLDRKILNCGSGPRIVPSPKVGSTKTGPRR